MKERLASASSVCEIVAAEVTAAAFGTRQRRLGDQAPDDEQVAQVVAGVWERRLELGDARQRFAQAALVPHQTDVRVHNVAQIADRLRLPAGRRPRPSAEGERLGRLAVAGAAFLTSVATREPYTSASSSELLASRFAPCTPVALVSPHAHRRPSVARPHSSTAMPPM